MSLMATTSTQVRCPQLCCAGCGGESVTATYRAKTVAVTPCASLLAQGWKGPQLVLSHNEAIARLVVA